MLADIDLDNRVYEMIKNKDSKMINRFIEDYNPFIINTASKLKKAYLDASNDEEYSLALMAFHEAMEKYEPSKGSFLSFARLVMKSRLTTYWLKEKKNKTEILDENMIIADNVSVELKDEIQIFEQELKKINLTFEDLVAYSPSHKATRKKTALLGHEISLKELWMIHLYAKKRLPITKISSTCDVSVKVVKTHKNYIASIALVFYNNLELIASWINFYKKGT